MLMPNDYSGIKQVRNVNGQRWIDDFKRSQVVVLLPSGLFFEVRKADVWRVARTWRIVYSIFDDLYVRKREVFAITGGYPSG
jgi:hypothetical protein